MSNYFKVLVTGGRDYGDRKTVSECLNELRESHRLMAVIQGGALGADALAEEWARHWGVPHVTHPAQWRNGPSAGPVRNAEMLDVWKPDLVLAFPGGRGTANCVALAEARGIKVMQAVP